MKEQFKVGDKVRCIESSARISNSDRVVKGEIYTIKDIDKHYVYLDGHSYTSGWYPSRFVSANDKSMEELIKHAQSLIGKKCVKINDDLHALSYEPNSIAIKYKGTSNSSMVDIYLKDHEFCVAVESKDGVKSYPVEWLELAKKQSIELKLNETYTAVISDAGIKVGCQTFPLSLAQELLDKVNEYKNQ